MIAKPGSVIKEEEGKSRRKIEREEKMERKQEGICQKRSLHIFFSCNLYRCFFCLEKYFLGKDITVESRAITPDLPLLRIPLCSFHA